MLLVVALFTRSVCLATTIGLTVLCISITVSRLFNVVGAILGVIVILPGIVKAAIIEVQGAHITVGLHEVIHETDMDMVEGEDDTRLYNLSGLIFMSAYFYSDRLFFV